MPVTGRLFKITQLDRFVASYLTDATRPDPTTYVPLGRARVKLLIRRSEAPPLVRECDTAADGTFGLPIPESPSPELMEGRIIVHRRIPVVTPDQVHAPPPDAPTVTQIAFRSSYVRLDRLQAEHLALYTAAPRVSTQLTEDELDAQLAAVASTLALDQLKAEIRDGGVHVRGRAGGATADAFVRVTPDLSERLDDVVSAHVDYVEVRVPRDATNVIVTEAELAERVGEALRGAFARLDDTILHALEGQVTAGGVADTATAHAIGQLMSVTVRRLGFPAALGRRSIEAKPVIGLPGGLLTPRPHASPVGAPVAAH
jgi:hypothetical protein